jgi:hypothetical protein
MLGVIGRQEKKGLEKLKYGETDGQAWPDTKYQLYACFPFQELIEYHSYNAGGLACRLKCPPGVNLIKTFFFVTK